MSPALTEQAPTPTDDPTVLRLIREEYAHADQLRAKLLGRFLAGLGALALLRFLLSAVGLWPLEPPLERGLLLVIFVSSGVGSLQIFLHSRARQPDERRAWVWYGSTVLEIGWVTSAWLLFGDLSPETNTRLPGTVGFAGLIILSALRLDWRITLFTGVLAAAADLTLHLSLSDRAMDSRPAGPAASVVLLVLMGILTALVAEQARRRTLHALAAVVARQSLEREVMEVADEERRRIGRDLHDGLGGRLSGLTLLAESLARRADAGDAVRAEDLRELAALSREGVDEARRLSRGLDPAPVELGLVSALQGLVERTRASGLECTFAVEGEEIALGREVTLHLYHIGQEAVTNALRHAGAARIDVRLTVRTGTVALDVRDDGIGIQESRSHGLGLRTMAKRAELIDAVLRIGPGVEGGTVVSCMVRRSGQG